jgi:hypothetical protein
LTRPAVTAATVNRFVRRQNFTRTEDASRYFLRLLSLVPESGREDSAAGVGFSLWCEIIPVRPEHIHHTRYCQRPVLRRSQKRSGEDQVADQSGARERRASDRWPPDDAQSDEVFQLSIDYKDEILEHC